MVSVLCYTSKMKISIYREMFRLNVCKNPIYSDSQKTTLKIKLIYDDGVRTHKVLHYNRILQIQIDSKVSLRLTAAKMAENLYFGIKKSHYLDTR